MNYRVRRNPWLGSSYRLRSDGPSLVIPDIILLFISSSAQDWIDALGVRDSDVADDNSLMS